MADKSDTSGASALMFVVGTFMFLAIQIGLAWAFLFFGVLGLSALLAYSSTKE